MKAIAITPMQKDSARIVDAPVPALHEHGVLVRVIRCGLCGTDAEINQGLYGEAPGGSDFLILGHENLGRVDQVGASVRAVKAGDLVVATVRRPDDCHNCSHGESDMCLKGNYAERGIKALHGYILTGHDLVHDQMPPTDAGSGRPRMPLQMETSVPGIFAAGDVRAGSTKQVASAVGEGASAAIAIREYLKR